MKLKQLVILLQFIIIFISSTSLTIACVTPTDELTINGNTDFCGGNYFINDTGNIGIIIINADNINLNCNNSYIHGNDTGYGIIIDSKNNITISNCNISDYTYGIYLIGSTEINIRNNSIFSNENAIMMNNVQDASIVNNTLYVNTGIGLYHGAISITNTNSNYTIIQNNSIEDNSRGIYIANGNYNNISTNKIRRNSNNIEISSGKYTLLETNLIEPGTTYGGTNTISIGNIFADWTAGPLDNFLVDFETITEAITASIPSEVIYAFEKTYDECLNITKSGLSINGAEKDNTKINCTTDAALNITSDGIGFNNFTLISYGGDYPLISLTGNNAFISNITLGSRQNGILIENSNNSILEYLKIEDITYAINITGTDNTTVKKSTFTNASMGAIDSTAINIQNNTFTSLESGSWDETATSFENTNDSTIENNTYGNISSAISIETSRNSNITGNSIKGNISFSQMAITLRNNTQSGIYKNTLREFQWGIFLENSESSTIDQNTVTNITSEYSAAIELARTNNTIITNNTIDTSISGITIAGGDTNTIYNNTIKDVANTSITIIPEYFSPLTLQRYNTIEKNTIKDTGTAITLNRTYSTKITGNTINNTTSPTSIYIENSSHDNITYNILENGMSAIELRGASNGFIQGNTIKSHTNQLIDYDQKDNIYNSENTITDNTITGGTEALSIRTFINGTITNNTITYASMYGIIIYQSENNLIANNTIKNIDTGTSTPSGIFMQDTGPNNTISLNHIQNTTKGIYIKNMQRPTISSNTITSNREYGIKISNVSYATIDNNTITYTYNQSSYAMYLEYLTNSTTRENTIKDNYYGLKILSASNANNISTNTFNNNTGNGFWITSSGNNIWMNNFSDPDNDFGTSGSNEYCIAGLDNHYSNPVYDSGWPYACIRNFENSFNDTAIYVNDTIEFTTNTSLSQSNITSLNITINNTNHTMTLKSGNNIKGIWTYEFNDTLLPGTYNATLIHYYEADYDKGTDDISSELWSFEVTELDISTQVYSSNITEPAWITAKITGNATPIGYVLSELYWNNTLIETANQTEYTKEGNNWTYSLRLNNTDRSGIYTLNTTVAASQNRTTTDTFQISYGNASINISTIPQLLAHNITTPQNYTLKAENGDLNNITITFESNDTSSIEIIPASWHISYMNASETTQLQINITANNTGPYRITINATPENGTTDTKTKDIQVKKINMTAYTYPETANVTQYINLTAYIQNNVTEITSVNAAISWNGTLQDTLPLNQSSIISGDADDNTYIYYRSTNITQRSGNYTVEFTATATNNATAAGHYYINYGTINITIYQSPSEMNTNTTKIQYVNITAINGDLENITATITIDNTSILNISSSETATKSYSYLNSTHTWNLNWQLNATSTTNATINITTEAYNTTAKSKQKTIRIKDLILNASLTPSTINITGDNMQIYANITGNITKIEYVTANVTWNATSKQNITLDFHRYYASEDRYEYIGTIADEKTDRSGYYEILITAKSDQIINTTKTFFVNYGNPMIIFGPDPQKINVSENRTQEITIKTVNGDLANITVKLTSDNETILNLSAGEDQIREIGYIYYSGGMSETGSGADTIISYNLTGISLGITNITANVTSKNNNTLAGKKDIEVTGETETNVPNVTAIWTNSTIFKYNLYDDIIVYANISEDSGLKTRTAEIRSPDGYKKNTTMIWSGTGITYITDSPFTNASLKDNYTIRIYAIDYYGNTNDTETKNFTVTDIYPVTTITTESLYNRGENATITITVYDINNNTVSNFNTSLNMTYQTNTTTLLENNQTGTYTHFINTSILGIHNLSAGVTKNGNIGNTTSTFNVTSILNLLIYTDYNITTFVPSNPVSLSAYAYYGRGESYVKELNVTLYCYNNTIGTAGEVKLKKYIDNKYIYDTKLCYASQVQCTEFEINGNITDSYNNTGEKSITLDTNYGCGISSSSSSSSSSGGGGGGIGGFIGNQTERIIERFFGNQTEKESVNDFGFILNKKEIIIQQGKNTTIIGTLNNIGDIDQEITFEVTKECCKVDIEKKTFNVATRNTEDMPILIHTSLTSQPGEYLITIAMKSENITKTETIKITIIENQLISTLKKLETKVIEHEKDIDTYAKAGVNVKHLAQALQDLKSYLEYAKDYIEKDNLENLDDTVRKANEKSYYIATELLRLETMKWLNENKIEILGAILLSIMLVYLLVYFIIPYTYMKKELTQLKTKEIQLKDAEKTVQKQYFMRQLDEITFNKLMSEKHSSLLDTRSAIKQIEEKIRLLKWGKLNLKEDEHSKYFILNKLTKNKNPKADTEKKTSILDKIKSLKEQQYNLLQSTKEAEKNYYLQFITQNELEQIVNNNKTKINETIKQLKELEQPENAPQITKEKKPDIITEIKKRYRQYRIQKQKIQIENKIKSLEKKEHTLEQKEKELNLKEEDIEKEIDTLKKEDNHLKEKKNEPTDSE